jgi:hypothetical protein
VAGGTEGRLALLYEGHDDESAFYCRFDGQSGGDVHGWVLRSIFGDKENYNFNAGRNDGDDHHNGSGKERQQSAAGSAVAERGFQFGAAHQSDAQARELRHHPSLALRASVTDTSRRDG